MASSIPLLRLSLLPHRETGAPLHRNISAPLYRKTSAVLLPHPLKFTLPSPPHLSRPLRKPSTVATRCSYTPTPAADRLISAASYFLPLFNGLTYGRFLFEKYPILFVLFRPIMPFHSLYLSLTFSVPYFSLITFFGLYIGVARNPSLSRYVRYNALQALVLDVLLALPMLTQKIFGPARSGIALKITAWAYSGLFMFVVACFVYGLVSTVLGKTPYLPLVAEAAGRQFD